MVRYCRTHRGMTSHVARTEPPFGADCVPCLRADRWRSGRWLLGLAVLIVALGIVAWLR